MFQKDGTKHASQASYGMKGDNMKQTMILLSLLFLAVGCAMARRDSEVPSLQTPINEEPSLPPQAVVSQQAINIPTVILSASQEPVGQSRPIYKDANYVFVTRSYGSKGKQVPGLFVFSNKTRKWMEINRLSTKDARLGSSKTIEAAHCTVGWDYSGLRKADYATIPLRTSGSLNFPDKILYQADASVYLLQHNSSWNIEAVLTQFIVKKDDLDKAFENEVEKLPQQGAPADAKRPRR
jgi:hypothetical protein